MLSSERLDRRYQRTTQETDATMKSAYELAMERLGGETPLTDEKKAALAEIDVRCRAKEAEVRLAYDVKLKGGTPAAQADEELAIDLRRINDKRESEKAAIRKSKP
jgi:hypothetical protein